MNLYDEKALEECSGKTVQSAELLEDLGAGFVRVTFMDGRELFIHPHARRGVDVHLTQPAEEKPKTVTVPAELLELLGEIASEWHTHCVDKAREFEDDPTFKQAHLFYKEDAEKAAAAHQQVEAILREKAK